MPTIKDVAAEAGVTYTTVSRVLNNRGYISEETREKVYSAMKKLNYMPNEMARNLSRQKSDYIGVILPSVEHPYFRIRFQPPSLFQQAITKNRRILKLYDYCADSTNTTRFRIG